MKEDLLKLKNAIFLVERKKSRAKPHHTTTSIFLGTFSAKKKKFLSKAQIYTIYS